MTDISDFLKKNIAKRVLVAEHFPTKGISDARKFRIVEHKNVPLLFSGMGFATIVLNWEDDKTKVYSFPVHRLYAFEFEGGPMQTFLEAAFTMAQDQMQMIRAMARAQKEGTSPAEA